MAGRRRGKSSNNQLRDGLARYALNITRERYTDFRPKLACEKITDLNDVHLSKEAVPILMIEVGLCSPANFLRQVFNSHAIDGSAATN